jgi:hypothetical protein
MLSPPQRRSGRRTNVGTGNATFVGIDSGFDITVSGNRTVSARYGHVWLTPYLISTKQQIK